VRFLDEHHVAGGLSLFSQRYYYETSSDRTLHLALFKEFCCTSPSKFRKTSPCVLIIPFKMSTSILPEYSQREIASSVAYGSAGTSRTKRCLVIMQRTHAIIREFTKEGFAKRLQLEVTQIPLIEQIGLILSLDQVRISDLDLWLSTRILGLLCVWVYSILACFGLLRRPSCDVALFTKLSRGDQHLRIAHIMDRASPYTLGSRLLNRIVSA
jgi:hypothetical protein